MKSSIAYSRNALLDQLLNLVDSRYGSGDQQDFSKYQADPVKFGEKVLGEKFTVEVEKLMESVRDNPITVAKSANAVGKTHAAARAAVWFYKCFPNSQVYTAAAPPEGNLKKILWSEIGHLVESHPDIFKNDKQMVLEVSRSAKSFLVGVTIPTSGTETQREAKFSGKHAPYLLFLVDEGDAVPDEVYKGIESCISGGHVRVLIMFNPRAEGGAVHRLERDHKANIVHLSALNHPNVTSGEDKIPGAVTRETTVRRINEWCRPLAEDEIPGADTFELPEYLEGTVASSHAGDPYPALKPGHYKIETPEFYYMVLGEYPAAGANKLINREWIQQARENWDLYVAENGAVPLPGVRALMGLDVAEMGDDSNVGCFRYGSFVDKLVTWGGMDTIAGGDRALLEYESRDVSRINIDGHGVGAGVAPYLRRQGAPAVSVKVASKATQSTEIGEFQILRDQLWWACREWLRTDPGAMLPPDELLVEELSCPTYEVENSKIRVMKKATMRELLKRSPDRADALCLTFDQSGFFAGCDI
jgi:hypothetical protein